MGCCKDDEGLKEVQYNGENSDCVTVKLICKSSAGSKHKLRDLIDKLDLPEEPIEITISYKIKKLYPL